MLIRVVAVFRVNLALGIVGGTIKSFARRERPSPANELRRGTIPKAILVNIEEKVEPAPPDDDGFRHRMSDSFICVFLLAAAHFRCNYNFAF